jgi:hypothetical protein
MTATSSVTSAACGGRLGLADTLRLDQQLDAARVTLGEAWEALDDGTGDPLVSEACHNLHSGPNPPKRANPVHGTLRTCPPHRSPRIDHFHIRREFPIDTFPLLD